MRSKISNLTKKLSLKNRPNQSRLKNQKFNLRLNRAFFRNLRLKLTKKRSSQRATKNNPKRLQLAHWQRVKRLNLQK